MNNPTPKFSTLYLWDFNIKSAVQMIIGSLLFQVVTYMGFGMFYPPIVMILAGLTVIGVVWLFMRYNQIMSTFREGITVQAKLTERETLVSRQEKGRTRRSYYAKVTYTVGSETFSPRTRLPDDPLFLGVDDDGNIEIILREEKPALFFFKQAYLTK
ncbi:MAG: hypothetical protein RIR73_177 [Chloroflexota bacterium]|jgi:hypothetical protein